MAIPVRRSAGIVGALVLLIAVVGSVTSSSRTSAAGVDYLRDQDANYAAAQGLLSAHLAAFGNYAGDWIASDGIQVSLVGPPSAAIRAVVARDDPRYQGKPVPVRYHSVRHTLSDLRALMNRIEADTRFWQQHGMQWSSLGPAVAINLVHITLFHYTKAYRDVLIARYGRDWVTVEPHDVVNVGV
jgi:hypothetical protein